MGEAEITYKVNKEDLKGALNDTIAEMVEASVLNKFYNVMVSVKTVAEIHGVSEKTVFNYIKDGMIEPEPRVKNGKVQFRLSYALQLDFSLLRKQLRNNLKIA